ncbi:MAG TPA: hypothetical protein VF792_04285, partial [Ktedonobacterales bacterium]
RQVAQHCTALLQVVFHCLRHGLPSQSTCLSPCLSPLGPSQLVPIRLGDVLKMAHPRVIIVCDAPVATAPRKGVTFSANMWASDADVAAAIHAQVYRLSATGALSLSGDTSGWELG